MTVNMEIFCVSRCSLSLSLSLSLCLSLSLAPWFYIPTLRIGLCSRGSLALQSIELIDLIIQRFLPCLVQCNATATAVFFGKRRTHTQRICSHNVFSWPKMIRWHDITFHVHSMYIPCTTLSQAACTEAHSSWLHSKHEKTWVTGLCDQAASVPQDGTWWD
jgi:hypothetical protein